MPTTANYALPTPGLTGVTPDIPRDLQALADAVDSQLKVEEDAREAATVPSASITNAWTAATGWSLDSQQTILLGKLLFSSLTFTRTGADISVPSGGNITNSAVATLSSSYPLQAINFAFSSGATGRVGGFVIQGGTLSLTAVGGSDNVTTGQQLSCAGWAMLA